MADNIVFPVAPSTATVATDEVDLGHGLAHVPFGKIVDGADGGTTPLAVRPDGGLSISRQFGIIGGMVTPGLTSYTDGQFVGGFAAPVNVQSGLYLMRNATLIAFGGQDLTGLSFHVLTYSNGPGATPSMPADGDPFSISFDGTLGRPGPIPGGSGMDWSAPFAAAGFTTVASAKLDAQLGNSPFVFIDPTDGDPFAPGKTADVSVAIAADGAIADDLTGGPLFLVLSVERMGAWYGV